MGRNLRAALGQALVGVGQAVLAADLEQGLGTIAAGLGLGLPVVPHLDFPVQGSRVPSFRAGKRKLQQMTKNIHKNK